LLLIIALGAMALVLYLRWQLERAKALNVAYLKEKKAVYAFLNQIGERMSHETDLDGTLKEIVAFLVETTRAQAGAVFLMDDSRETLRARVLVGLFPPFQHTLDRALTKTKFLHERMKRDPIPVGQGIIGMVAQTGQPLLIEHAREDPRIAQTPGLEIETLIATPLIVSDRIEGVFALVNRAGAVPFVDADLGMLRALAEQASVTIQLVKMYAAMTEQQRLVQEVKIARDFQKMLLPEHCPEIPGIEIAAASRPALEVGGDFYDFFWLDESRLGIVIADVSGKGIPGALIMSMVRSVVRAESRRASSPRDVLLAVNQTIHSDTRENVFITMTFAILDLARKRFTFARAGHEPLVAFSPSNGGLRLISPEGIALGLVDEEIFSVIRDQEMSFQEGDVFVLYTDGVIEAMDRAGHEYGQERFLETIRTHANLPAERLLDDLVTNIRDFTRGGRQSDDITLVVLKFNRLADLAERPRAEVPAAAGRSNEEENLETV
jgi:sigma-B regulation protein RsbU (phosphoserine phosphatase)